MGTKHGVNDSQWNVAYEYEYLRLSINLWLLDYICRAVDNATKAPQAQQPRSMFTNLPTPMHKIRGIEHIDDAVFNTQVK